MHKIEAFKIVANKLNGKSVNWAVGASFLLYLKGIIQEFNDFDLMIDIKDIKPAQDIFEQLGQAKQETFNHHFKSDFFKTYLFDGIEFDIIAGFRIINNQEYYFPFKKATEHFDLDGIDVPLDSLSNWMYYYQLMNRPAKAKLICDYYGHQLNDYLFAQRQDNILKYQQHVLKDENLPIIGIGIPKLRKIAKKIVCEDFDFFMQINQHLTFENVLLEGLAIGYYRTDLNEKLRLIDRYLPLIENWEICDTFVATLKFETNEKQQVFNFIKRYLNSSNPYAIRFSLVMMLYYYIDNVYFEDILITIKAIKSKNYYVEMALAWLLSMMYLKNPKRIIDYLNKHYLNDSVYNKTLQKICESTQVDESTKQYLKKLKIK